LKKIELVLTVSLLLLWTSCGGGSGTNGGGGGEGSHDAVLKNGNWYIEATSQVVAGQKSHIGGNLTQSGTTLTGTMHINNSDCFNLFTNIPVTGSVSGTTATITSGSVDSQVITASANSINDSTMTGSYTIAGGCGGGDHGTIQAVWKATEAHGGVTTTTTATITQSTTANSDGVFLISGTINFTNGGCSTSATIDQEASFIAGDVIGVFANTSDIGGGQGSLVYAGFLDQAATATSFGGQYQYQSGVCNAVGGTLNFTKQ
jgi:hypothetical protein